MRIRKHVIDNVTNDRRHDEENPTRASRARIAAASSMQGVHALRSIEHALIDDDLLIADNQTSTFYDAAAFDAFIAESYAAQG
jgi:hypothetical protein